MGRPAARAAAARLLEALLVEDNDDRARRIPALAAEGRPVGFLTVPLAASADPSGGWGLTAEFVADPLDSALALGALANQPAVDDTLLRGALSSLLSAQLPDGAGRAWPPATPRSRARSSARLRPCAVSRPFAAASSSPRRSTPRWPSSARGAMRTAASALSAAMQ